MTEPPWVAEGRRWVGLAEIPGREHAPAIRRWLLDLGAWWSDDETPWCGVYAAHCMRAVGSEPPRAFYRARAWLDWGIELEKPLIGCVAVYERKGGGHVGMIVGRYPPLGLSVLGGNQGNQVSVAVFSREPLGYRWPKEFGYLMPDFDKVLPVVPAMRSRSEA
jgi:uncharacterized protein (TIGR02594 family)